jgi:hypothetical protein
MKYIELDIAPCAFNPCLQIVPAHCNIISVTMPGQVESGIISKHSFGRKQFVIFTF